MSGFPFPRRPLSRCGPLRKTGNLLPCLKPRNGFHHFSSAGPNLLSLLFFFLPAASRISTEKKNDLGRMRRLARGRAFGQMKSAKPESFSSFFRGPFEKQFTLQRSAALFDVQRLQANAGRHGAETKQRSKLLQEKENVLFFPFRRQPPRKSAPRYNPQLHGQPENYHPCLKPGNQAHVILGPTNRA